MTERWRRIEHEIVKGLEGLERIAVEASRPLLFGPAQHPLAQQQRDGVTLCHHRKRGAGYAAQKRIIVWAGGGGGSHGRLPTVK